MKQIRVDVGAGLELAVEERGAGEPVVILHGFTGCATSMRGVAEALARSRRIRALSVDLIGHGASSKPHDGDCYAMTECVRQLRQLLDHLGIDRAGWLGYSMGGRTALAFATTHPTRVTRLLLVGASAGLADPAERADRIASDEALAERIERDGLETFVDRWMALPLFASQKRLGDHALSTARAQRLDNSPHALARSLRGMGSGAQESLHAQLRDVHAPVVLAVGDEDTKFEAIARELVAAFPEARGARAVRIAEAGHAAHLENPRAFNELALRFFDPERAP